MRKNTDSLNLDLSIRFFEDLVGMLKELKTLRELRDSGTLSPQSTAPFDLEVLLQSWPEAVPQILLCDNSEGEKTERAEGIVAEFFSTPAQNVLDFGCGEGHLVHQLGKIHNKVLGYDISKHNNSLWQLDGLLTDKYEIAQSHGPYDLIILYDVIDHAAQESPVAILKKAASLLAPNGKVFVRCHPWCSRHGGHLYNKKNKAYLHLLLTPEELKQLGLEPPEGQRVLYPLKTYKEWLQQAGLAVKKEEIQRHPVESFFTDTPSVSQRICTIFDKPLSEFPHFQLEQAFVDFVCERGA